MNNSFYLKFWLDLLSQAMIICDRAHQHTHRAFLALRNLWAEANNCIIFGSDPTASVQVPSKIGACGAPNDAYHQWLHMLRKYKERCRLGWNGILTTEETLAT